MPKFTTTIVCLCKRCQIESIFCSFGSDCTYPLQPDLSTCKYKIHAKIVCAVHFSLPSAIKSLECFYRTTEILHLFQDYHYCRSSSIGSNIPVHSYRIPFIAYVDSKPVVNSVASNLSKDRPVTLWRSTNGRITVSRRRMGTSFFDQDRRLHISYYVGYVQKAGMFALRVGLPDESVVPQYNSRFFDRMEGTAPRRCKFLGGGTVGRVGPVLDRAPTHLQTLMPSRPLMVSC